MLRLAQDQGGLSQINNDDFHTYASQLPDDPDMPKLKDITYSDDEDDVGAVADFNNLKTSITKVCVLVDLPYGKRAIGTKWAFKNKKDEIGIVARNKARLVAQGYTLEDGIDYKEVFAPVARIEAIRLFLAYASLMGFMVYQMDVKSAFYMELLRKKFILSDGRSDSTPIDTEKPLLKDPNDEDVDVYTY
nr:copia protein [Tanacetum cinerariifolium]